MEGKPNPAGHRSPTELASFSASTSDVESMHVLQLPADRPRSGARHYTHERVSRRLSLQVTEALEARARACGVSLTALLVGAWSTLLARWSGQWVTRIGLSSARWQHPKQRIVELHLSPEMTIGELASIAAAALDCPERFVDPRHLEHLLDIEDRDEHVAYSVEYTPELFDRSTIERMLDSWHVLLRGLARDEGCSLAQLNLLSPEERARVLELGTTSSTTHSNQLIHELFELQARDRASTIAVTDQSGSITFASLNERVNQLAHYLRERGVRRGHLVGLCVERGIDMVVGILGVLKAGAAYVPLDPEYPAERVAYMLQDSGTKLVVTQERLRHLLPFPAAATVAIDADWSAISKASTRNVPASQIALAPDDLAFVIYTSGSTGMPKGAMNEHRGMVNRILAQHRIEALSASDVCCQKTSISFVDAVLETLGPLCVGVPLVIIPPSAVRNVREMAVLIARAGITRLTTVPSLARAMLASPEVIRNLATLRSWTLSGELVQPDLLEKLQQVLPGCDFINQYGSSEISSDATCYKTRCFHGERVPVGTPLPNVRVRVLDASGNLVPRGVVGEIHVGGIGVGRGYLGRPELTAQRFVPDPFTPGGHRSRMFRTGDLGRWRADGLLECLGRSDNQIKIRGFRVELGEIESQLLRLPEVCEAAVLAREDTPGEPRLVAYVAFREPSEGSVRALRAALSEVLPEFMLPSAFVLLKKLPKTPNGKLDRRALPAPGPDAYAFRPYEVPRGEAERTVAAIWQELLGLQRVGRHDNFFELGGHSLLILRMLERLREDSFSADVRTLYENPTLCALARALESESCVQRSIPGNLIPSECEKIEPQMLTLIDLTQEQIDRIVAAVPGGSRNVQDIYPLAPLQEGILFHHLLNEHRGDTYVRATLIELPTRMKLDSLIAALQQVIDRNDVLRTALQWEGLPGPVQVVWRRAVLPVEEFSIDKDAGVLEQLHERLRPERQQMDLRSAPLIRLQIAASPLGAQWYAVLQTHHLACDNESLETLFAEVAACLNGSGSQLSEPVAYRDHVAQAIQSAREHDAEAFFREKLADVFEPSAPFGLLDVRGDSARIEAIRQPFDAALADRVRFNASKRGTSAATLFHAAWALVVGLTSGRDDVVFGTVLLGRMQGASARRALGMFINTLPMRLPLVNLSVSALVDRTHRELLDLLTHEQASLSVAQRCSGIGGDTPLFTALLNYLHAASGLETEQIERASEGRVLAMREWTNYPVVLSVEDHGKAFTLAIQTDRRVDPRRISDYLHAAMEALLVSLGNAPETRVRALQLLPHAEFTRVVEEFNNSRANYPNDTTVHELVEAQVKLAPDAIAVTCGNEQLTYGELNRRANHVARVLRARGIRPDDRVALLVERSPELVIALLGVAKAGGAYVPLDSRHPAERLASMIRDSGPLVVLTQRHLLASIPETGVESLLLDDPRGEIVGEAEENPEPSQLGLTAENLVYVIYTSGSTGMPKGVMVSHRNLVNLVYWHHQAFGVVNGTCCSCLAAVGFDALGWEIWPTLAAGGTLYVAPAEVSLDTQALIEWWAKQPIEVGFLPTPLAELVFARGIRRHPTLRKLLIGGDRLRSHPPRVSYEVINNYGPTEITVVATSERIRHDDETLHIGRPIANTSVYVLDNSLRPVPVGVCGELYVAGAGVARGYLNLETLTHERFLPNPFIPGKRMYRTGDLARWLDDGTLEFLGRNDDQIKIRGLRIELGEIESQLSRHPQVREAIVVARDDGTGEKRLVAYVVATEHCEDAAPPSAAALRTYLNGKLPPYMAPSAFVLMDRIPLTANGKLDRKALPPPDLAAFANREYEPPRDEAEQVLASVWQDVLGVARVGRGDNFFELGGHSLLIVRMVDQLRRAGFSAPVRSVFQCQTVADLAAVLTKDAGAEVIVPPNLIPAGCRTITPSMLPLVTLTQDQIDIVARSVPGGAENIQDIYPLAPLQEGILFHHLLDDRQGDAYVLATVLSVSSRRRLDELIQALQVVVDRHDVLRTAVMWEDLPRPVQVVCRRLELPVHEVVFDGSRSVREHIQEWIRPSRQRIDLRSAPLLRLEVARDPAGGETWYVLLQAHHITSDHVTLDIVLSEVSALLSGRTASMLPSIPYRNHVAQSLVLSRAHDAEGFFRAKLEDIEASTAPFGLLDVLGDGSQISEARCELEPRLARQIRAKARQLGLTVATLFHAAWSLVVAHTSGREDVVFGSVLLGRLQGDAGGLRALGMYINTLPVRINLRDLSARALVERTQQELIELLSHEQASLALAQRCSGVAGSSPLFTTLLNYRHSTAGTVGGWAHTEGIEVLEDQERTNYPITVSVDDFGDGFALVAQTDQRIDPERIARYFYTALAALVDVVEEMPLTPALALPVLPPEERDLVVEKFNASDASYPTDKFVQELFEDQVRARPQATAIIHDDASLTYAELNARSNQLARYLNELGIGPGRVVALSVERGIEMVVGLLGVLKAGAAYIPIDPSYPADRIEYMLCDAAPALVIAQEKLRDRIPPSGTRSISLDHILARIAHVDAENLPLPEGIDPKDAPVYVLYTSGSTGLPKGTVMGHRSMVNLIEWHRWTFGDGAGRRVLQFAALSFDVAFQEIFSTLCTGATLVLLDEWVRKDVRALAERINGQSVERLFLPPLMLQTLAEFFGESGGAPRSIRDVITAGEQLRITAEVRAMFSRLPGVRLHNHYGPTETHVVTALTLEGDPQSWPELPSIGRPITNSRIYVLNEHGQPVPQGVIGEICIGGDGVALGYLRKPELTAQRFLDDPFAPHPGARMYRTGDIGRWNGDGTIEYVGRNDIQVKIRGFRVEPGEIEARLRQLAGIREAVVLARQDGPGQKRLVAYVTTHTACQVAPNQLRAHLKGTLPDYMLPSAFVVLDEWPLTPSGKLNRRALPEPGPLAYATRAYEAPQGEVEKILAEIWCALLGLERVGRDDNFFELGGHSLLMVQMMERLRRVGFAVRVRNVYESPTLSALAGTLRSESSRVSVVPDNFIPDECSGIRPEMLPLVSLEPEHIAFIESAVPGGARNIKDIYPLAPLQEGILFHHLLKEDDGDTYVLPTLFELPSRAALDKFVEALQWVIDRHDVLRTAVHWEQLPRAVQVVCRQATLPVEELELDPARDALIQLQELMAPRRQRLNLRRAPMIRLRVYPDRPRSKWFVLMQLHHLVCDHESLEIMLSEVKARITGHSGSLPPAIPYRNHVAQALEYARTSDAQAFFRSRLQDVDAPTAPFGLLNVHGDGCDLSVARHELDVELSRRIRRQARILGVAPATLWHAAWGLVIARTSGRDDMVFGSVLLGRLQGSAGAQRTLGMFINTLPLRLRLNGCTAKALIEQTQKELVALLNHEQASLADAQRCSGVAGNTPLFTALLNYRHTTPAIDDDLERATGVRLIAELGWTNYPFMLSVDDLGEDFIVTVDCDRRVEPQRMLGYVNTAVCSLVDALEQGSLAPALTLPVLPAAELARLSLFNSTRRETPRGKLIHELFEEQARHTTQVIAVERDSDRLTYAELDARANRLAGYLIGEGVGPDRLVGICARRTVDMIVAVLGTLKAGGAYLPLDPGYPAERLRYMLDDGRPRLVLAQRDTLPALDGMPGWILALEDIEASIASGSPEGPPTVRGRVNDRNLVYVIYTSGSTGKPKATAMAHRSMVNLIDWHRDVLPLTPGARVLQFAALGFDVAFQETFSTLCHGGTLVLIDEWVRRDAGALSVFLDEQGIERLFVPPLMLQSLAEHFVSTDVAPAHLRDVITAGEQLRITPEIAELFTRTPHCRLHNHYGPTETHVVTALTLQGNARTWPPLPSIGRPVANTQVHIVDAQRQPVPVGVVGEIYIGGASVARGYLGQPDLTSQRFMEDPFSAEDGARLYRTGDLGRWRDDGTIEYLGRNDHQVKIRGFRVELGEIETRLGQLKGIRDAVAIMREDVPGEKRLIAYVVSADSDKPSPQELRTHLSATLPDYMVPSAFVYLSSLPISPNGKLNRQALPAPEAGEFRGHSYQPPEGQTEEVLARIWEDLLHVARVGREDNFFELGGHSLNGMRLIARVEQSCHVRLSVASIFQFPTLRKMAGLVERLRNAAHRGSPAEDTMNFEEGML